MLRPTSLTVRAAAVFGAVLAIAGCSGPVSSQPTPKGPDTHTHRTQARDAIADDVSQQADAVATVAPAMPDLHRSPAEWIG